MNDINMSSMLFRFVLITNFVAAIKSPLRHQPPFLLAWRTRFVHKCPASLIP